MNHFSSNSLLAAIMLTATCHAEAQNELMHDKMPVTQYTWSIGSGRTQVLDTYLSAEHFSGTGITMLGSYTRQQPGKQWYTLWEHQINMSSCKDRADNESIMEGIYNLYWGRMRQWTLLDNSLSLSAGLVGDLGIGAIYDTRNGNNPVQARLHLLMQPTLAASYTFRIGRIPLRAGYEGQLPLAGVTFSPRYGQSYYEIFGRANYDRNVVFTTFVSAPTFRQQLTLDGRVWRNLTLRLGLMADIQQQHVNDIKQHVYSYRVMLGVTKRFSIISYAYPQRQ